MKTRASGLYSVPPDGPDRLRCVAAKSKAVVPATPLASRMLRLSQNLVCADGVSGTEDGSTVTTGMAGTGSPGIGSLGPCANAALQKKKKIRIPVNNFCNYDSPKNLLGTKRYYSRCLCRLRAVQNSCPPKLLEGYCWYRLFLLLFRQVT